MGLFKKKHDPVADRERSLNEQIASLEAEIKRLARAEAQGKVTPQRPGDAKPSAKASAKAPALPGQPRLRSTTHPHGPVPAANAAPITPAPAPSPAPAEPVFEPVEHKRLDHPEETATPAHYNDLGVRKYDLAAAWKRFLHHFRAPATSNPKLVNYLAAGSIQGLRPLRYEKRVARNRFLLLVGILFLVLWGIIYVFFARH